MNRAQTRRRVHGVLRRRWAWSWSRPRSCSRCAGRCRTSARSCCSARSSRCSENQVVELPRRRRRQPRASCSAWPRSSSFHEHGRAARPAARRDVRWPLPAADRAPRDWREDAVQQRATSGSRRSRPRWCSTRSRRRHPRRSVTLLAARRSPRARRVRGRQRRSSSAGSRSVLERGELPRRPRRDRSAAIACRCYPFAVLGVFLGMLYVDYGAVLVPLFVVPILVARQAFAVVPRPEGVPGGGGADAHRRARGQGPVHRRSRGASRRLRGVHRPGARACRRPAWSGSASPR